jgi:hypothetical protein
MAVITVVFAALLGSEQITPERYATFLVVVRISFSISSLLCFLGVFFSWFRGNLHGGASGKGEREDVE